MGILKMELKTENALAMQDDMEIYHMMQRELIVLVLFLDVGIKEQNMVPALFLKLLENWVKNLNLLTRKNIKVW